MKRPLKHYAIALYDAVKTPQARVTDVVSNFVHVLAHDGVLSRTGKIIELFRTHWNEREKEIDVAFTVAHPITEALEKRMSTAVQSSLHVERVQVATHIDLTIIGGAIVRTSDIVIDGSVRRQLSQIKNLLQT